MGNKNDLKIDLNIIYVPLPEDKTEAWRESMLLLLKLTRECEDADHEQTDNDGVNLRMDAIT